MILTILRKIKTIYESLFLSPEAYARKIGVTIGKNCFIGIRHWSSEPYLIEIGDNVAITKGVQLHTHGGGRVARKRYPNFDVFGRVVIKSGAYIGSGSQIMPGVTIGEGSLIAAGSIVTKSVPDGEVWGGNPARKLCTVDEYINKNIPFNLNTKKLNPEEKKAFLLSCDDSKFIHK